MTEAEFWMGLRRHHLGIAALIEKHRLSTKELQNEALLAAQERLRAERTGGTYGEDVPWGTR